MRAPHSLLQLHCGHGVVGALVAYQLVIQLCKQEEVLLPGEAILHLEVAPCSCSQWAT